MKFSETKFYIGQIINHKRFNYRGVIIDVDLSYSGTEEWYLKMAKSKPSKEQPWYYVIVNNSEIETYVAESNINIDRTGLPINHPQIYTYFDDLTSEGYILKNNNLT